MTRKETRENRIRELMSMCNENSQSITSPIYSEYISLLLETNRELVKEVRATSKIILAMIVASFVINAITLLLYV